MCVCQLLDGVGICHCLAASLTLNFLADCYFSSALLLPIFRRKQLFIRVKWHVHDTCKHTVHAYTPIWVRAVAHERILNEFAGHGKQILLT